MDDVSGSIGYSRSLSFLLCFHVFVGGFPPCCYPRMDRNVL